MKMQARAVFDCALRAVTPWQRAAAAIASSRLLFVGETHQQSQVINIQQAIIEEAASSIKLAQASTKSSIHVVLEHFSIDQQPSLDSFFQGHSSWERLVSSYDEGTEGFELAAYKPIFDSLKKESEGGVIDVRVWGGFIPRPRARDYVTTASADARAALLERDKASGFLSAEALALKPSLFAAPLAGLGELTHSPLGGSSGGEGIVPSALQASPAHKSFFLSLLSGVDLPCAPEQAEEDFGGDAPRSPIDPRQPSRILPAQVIKDLSAASIVAKALLLALASSSTSKVVVLCGKGHSDFGFGIPERSLALIKDKAADAIPVPTVVFSCRDEREDKATWHHSYFADGTRRLPAHFIVPYTADPESEEDDEPISSAPAAGSGHQPSGGSGSAGPA